jgi:hypothetical protein
MSVDLYASLLQNSPSFRLCRNHQALLLHPRLLLPLKRLENVGLQQTPSKRAREENPTRASRNR